MTDAERATLDSLRDTRASPAWAALRRESDRMVGDALANLASAKLDTQAGVIAAARQQERIGLLRRLFGLDGGASIADDIIERIEKSNAKKDGDGK